MALSPYLVRKLEEVLGHDAAEDLMAHLTSVESLRADVAELRHEMQLGFARLETRIESSTAALMKWSSLFWIGAVAAIAGLAGVLR